MWVECTPNMSLGGFFILATYCWPEVQFRLFFGIKQEITKTKVFLNVLQFLCSNTFLIQRNLGDEATPDCLDRAFQSILKHFKWEKSISNGNNNFYRSSTNEFTIKGCIFRQTFVIETLSSVNCRIVKCARLNVLGCHFVFGIPPG